MSFKLSDKEGKRFLIISYEMPEGPATLSFKRDDIVECHSSSVGQVKRESYIELLMNSSGVYMFCHRGVISWRVNCLIGGELTIV